MRGFLIRVLMVVGLGLTGFCAWKWYEAASAEPETRYILMIGEGAEVTTNEDDLAARAFAWMVLTFAVIPGLVLFWYACHWLLFGYFHRGSDVIGSGSI